MQYGVTIDYQLVSGQGGGYSFVNCAYYAISSGTTARENNPYYIPDFNGGDSSDDNANENCPVLDEYGGCAGLTSAEVGGIVAASIVGVVLFGVGVYKGCCVDDYSG